MPTIEELQEALLAEKDKNRELTKSNDDLTKANKDLTQQNEKLIEHNNKLFARVSMPDTEQYSEKSDEELEKDLITEIREKMKKLK